MATTTAVFGREQERDDTELARLRKFATVLDDYYVDPILGFLIPGFGDIVSSALGLWIVMVAARRGVAKVVLARMLLNLTIDAVIGAIPFVGDLFDIAFKANDKNLALLEAREVTRASTPGDWALVLGAVALFIGTIGGLLYVVGRLLEAVLR